MMPYRHTGWAGMQHFQFLGYEYHGEYHDQRFGVDGFAEPEFHQQES
jgi:hypothetical protein